MTVLRLQSLGVDCADRHPIVRAPATGSTLATTLKSAAMAYPETEILDWTAAILDTEVTVLRGLRHRSSPWLLRAGYREEVLRVAHAEQAAETATEVAAMTCVARVAMPSCRSRNCSATTSRSVPGTGSS